VSIQQEDTAVPHLEPVGIVSRVTTWSTVAGEVKVQSGTLKKQHEAEGPVEPTEANSNAILETKRQDAHKQDDGTLPLQQSTKTDNICPPVYWPSVPGEIVVDWTPRYRHIGDNASSCADTAIKARKLPSSMKRRKGRIVPVVPLHSAPSPASLVSKKRRVGGEYS